MTPSDLPARIAAVKARYPGVTAPVYLDYQASTPLDPAAAAAMKPFLEGRFGNPHARAHAFGWKAEATVDAAREDIAALIGADPEEIIFTSGATESNNLAVKGAVYAQALAGKKHIVTSTIEHKCVLDSCLALERAGCSVTFVPPEKDGIVRPEAIEAAIKDTTALVSVMAANNEIGTIQPAEEIAALCGARGVPFHSDAAQAAGKIKLNMRESRVSLLSLSAHKMYGPLGIGALYIRRRPRLRLEPLIHGGGQEKGIRSGTLSPMLCAGFGAAARAAVSAARAGEAERLRTLSRLFLDLLREDMPDIALNGHSEQRLPGNCNIRFPGLKGDALISALRDIAVSAGSACASAGGEASYVLREIGLSDAEAKSSLRISLGRFTTEEEIRFAAEILKAGAGV